MPNNTNAFQANLPVFHRALQQWYEQAGRRHLPWRNTTDPYHIYLSEVMLQQTQVKTVLERFYYPFLKRFPTLKQLAKADRQAVMKSWEGLGYYNRAGNLHEAAKLSVKGLPDTVDALMELPGIGRNTAHAVACFAFGRAVPIMEANVKRVLCRVFAMRKANTEELWHKAEQLLDVNNAYNYNQAMMDIGAIICTKANPKCFECPLAIICKGKKSPLSYPAPKEAKVIPVRNRVIVAFYNKRKEYFIQKRSTRFLNGLYGFSEYDECIASVLLAGKKFKLTHKDLLGVITQTYSHFILNAKVYAIFVPDNLFQPMHTLEKIRNLPLSKADLKVVELLSVYKNGRI